MREGMTQVVDLFKILILCVLTGGLIGALDGLAVYVWNYGDEYALQTLIFEGVSLGIVLGPLLGVVAYYTVLGGRMSHSEFGMAALMTGITGGLCSLGLGRFFAEWSWLCTPVIMIVAAFVVRTRRLRLPKTS